MRIIELESGVVSGLCSQKSLTSLACNTSAVAPYATSYLQLNERKWESYFYLAWKMSAFV